MKDLRKVLNCIVLLSMLCATTLAQVVAPIPQEVYRDVPFDMRAIELPQFPDYKVSIVDFGAKSGSGFLNTEAINSAIRHVNERGGGVVVIPSGMWITGPIELLSNVCLHTESNAFILFSPDYSLYTRHDDNATTGRKKSQSPIHAYNAENIAITGEGVFDGNGNVWRMVKKDKMTENQWKQRIASGGVVVGDGKIWYPTKELSQRDFRPNMIRLWECKRVLLQGVTFRNSPAWCVHPIHCEELTLHKISVINPWYAQNGDALDIESCDRVLIYGCTIDAGDDAICIKSGKDEPGRRRGWPCRNVVARDNVVYHGHGGFVVGSEMSGGVKNIYIDNCTFIGTDVGIRFKSTRGRGGVVENIYCHRINMFEIANECILFDLYYAIKNADISQAKPVDEGTPEFRNIHISDVYGVGGRRAMFFNGLPEMPIRDITLRNISITDTKSGAVLRQSKNVVMENVSLTPHDGIPITLQNVSNALINGTSISKVGNEIREISFGSENCK